MENKQDIKLIIAKHIDKIYGEINVLHNERELLNQREQQIEVRLHQLVGAIHEMQELTMNLDRLSSDDVHIVNPSMASQVETDSLPVSQTLDQTSSETDDQSKEK